MPNLTVPEAGWTLGTAAEAISNSKAPGTPNIAPGTKQLMRLQFTEGTLLEELLKAGEFKVSFGKTITFLYENQAQEVLSKSEHVRTEVYETTEDGLIFSGLMTHQFEARRLENDLDDEAAVVALKQKMSALENEKKTKSTMLVDPRGGRGLPPKKLGKPTPMCARKGAENSLDLLAKSPLQTSPEIEAKLDALRPPLIHLLALGSDSERNLAMKTRAPVDLCLKILQRIGNKTRAGNHWELVDNIYRDLDLWKFPYGSQKDRDLAITNAKAAFERLRLPSDAPEWDLLVKPEDRGKVKVAPPPPPIPKPRPLPSLNVGKADDGRITPAEASPTASEHSTGADRLARSASQQPPNKTRRVGEKDTISRIIANKGKPPKPKKEPKEKKEKAPAGTKKLGRPPKPKGEGSATGKAQKRPTKWRHPEGGIAVQPQQQPVYKSKEFVESDSEPEDTGKTASKSPPALVPVSRAAKVNGKSPLPKAESKAESAKSTPLTASPVKKKVAEVKAAKPTTSPLPRKPGTASKTLPARTPESVPEKTPASKERPVAGAVGNKRPTTAKTKESKVTPIGRNTSPIKRSPLALSPTITAADAGSVTSTPKTLTSVGTVSTPTRSPSLATTTTASATVRSRPRQSQESAAPSTKRKVERVDEASPPPAPKRRFPDANTISLAKKFKDDWAEYARLYKEAQNTSGRLQKEKMSRVLQMHQDLKNLKIRLTNLAAA